MNYRKVGGSPLVVLLRRLSKHVRRREAMQSAIAQAIAYAKGEIISAIEQNIAAIKPQIKPCLVQRQLNTISLLTNGIKVSIINMSFETPKGRFPKSIKSRILEGFSCMVFEKYDPLFPISLA